MMQLGTKAPEFTLPDAVTGSQMSLTENKSDIATMVMFICNHCPFVKHVQDELVRLANDYVPKGIAIIAINSNDVDNYPEDSPAHMKQIAIEKNYPFPYLFDETQEVAKAFDAACTPDFFIYDKNLCLVYRGQIDDSRPGNNIPVDGQDIRAALDAMLLGNKVQADQKPSIGCNIKWKE